MNSAVRVTRWLAITFAILIVGSNAAMAQGGFDEFGYNERARIFVGIADGLDHSLDGTYLGDPTYANDHLVMKWNAAWDDCNDAGNADPDACSGAWTTNEWNGMVPGGSGETWSYKFVWIGACGAYGTPVEGGGYCIWDYYAVILSHGVVDGEHMWDVVAGPAGLGAYPL